MKSELTRMDSTFCISSFNLSSGVGVGVGEGVGVGAKTREKKVNQLSLNFKLKAVLNHPLKTSNKSITHVNH